MIKRKFKIKKNNIWTSHWKTPQEEIPSVIKSFIRWLEEPQTTTHEI